MPNFILTLILGLSTISRANTQDLNSFLPDCPTSPNCVSSLSRSPDHKVDPIPFEGQLDQFHTKIKTLEKVLPRFRLIEAEGARATFVATTMIFRFKDDVELYFSESEKLIHIRSASRVGYSDLGANRTRVEEIRKVLTSSN